jgi:hypothetical protein
MIRLTDDAFLQFVFQGKDDIEKLLPLLNRAMIGAAAVEVSLVLHCPLSNAPTDFRQGEVSATAQMP